MAVTCDLSAAWPGQIHGGVTPGECLQSRPHAAVGHPWEGMPH